MTILASRYFTGRGLLGCGGRFAWYHWLMWQCGMALLGLEASRCGYTRSGLDGRPTTAECGGNTTGYAGRASPVYQNIRGAKSIEIPYLEGPAPIPRPPHWHSPTGQCIMGDFLTIHHCLSIKYASISHHSMHGEIGENWNPVI